jgi:hypothetical protein
VRMHAPELSWRRQRTCIIAESEGTMQVDPEHSAPALERCTHDIGSHD